MSLLCFCSAATDSILFDSFLANSLQIACVSSFFLWFLLQIACKHEERNATYLQAIYKKNNQKV